MKQINVWFEDKEHKKFADKKDELGLNWHDFLLKMLELIEDKRKSNTT